jgi:uncharacterized protein with beta-barrel porin domain
MAALAAMAASAACENGENISVASMAAWHSAWRSPGKQQPSMKMNQWQ